MRLIFSLFLIWCSFQSISSQDLDSVSYFQISIEKPRIYFEDKRQSLTPFLGSNLKFSSSDFNHLNFDSERINKHILFNICFSPKIFNDYKDYFRGCKSLQDGIYSSIKSGDLILSMSMDYFVNNILFPNGVLFKGKKVRF